MLKRDKITCPRKKKGQSTIEYIILVAVVIGALLGFAGTFSSNIESVFKTGTNGMDNMANRLMRSRP